MGDPSLVPGSSRNAESAIVVAGKKGSKKAFPQGNHRQAALLSRSKIVGGGAAGDVALFLLKVAALETVRRVSKAKCPCIWRGIQALQVVCYPPFKFINRWAPFKGLIRGMQMLSRPLLLLSVAEAFSEQSVCSDDSDGNSDSHEHSEINSEPSLVNSQLDARVSDEVSPSLTSENWLIQLHNELESQGISLTERINEDMLHRFYSASNGDISSLVASIKKTIRWRETYRILSEEELEEWSDVVFWHGVDMQHRPCLIVRLGLGCCVLPSRDRPRFAQAIISQVEHGVLHLFDAANTRITVLVDCEGLTPFRIPMQVLRSCSSILQDHFPNHLGCLLVIRLPPVLRVITQTFIQILKPTTRKKVKIEGEMFRKVLSEYLQTLPSYLGGNCTCMRCLKISNLDALPPLAKETNVMQPYSDVSDDEDLPSSHPSHQTDINMNGNCDQVLRAAVIGILMLWVFIALIAGLSDPDSRPF